MPKGATKSTKKSILEVLYRRNIDGLGALLAPSCKNIHGRNRPEIPTKLRANYSDNRFNLTFKSIQINT